MLSPSVSWGLVGPGFVLGSFLLQIDDPGCLILKGWLGSTSFSTVFCSVLNSAPHFVGCFNLQVFK